jgi:hypothetical protein
VVGEDCEIKTPRPKCLKFTISIALAKVQQQNIQKSIPLLRFRGSQMIDICSRVFGDSFFEEIGFAREGDHIHEIEGVCGLIHFFISERDEETVSDEFNVLAHERGVHSD